MPLDDTTRRGKATAKQPTKRTIAARLRKAQRAGAALTFRHAQAARRKAETDYEAAMKLCVGCGVLPDFAANPEEPGTNRVVYADGATQITLFVAEPIEGINTAGFIADLIRAEVDPKLVRRLAKKHRTEARPAHRLTSSPVG